METAEQGWAASAPAPGPAGPRVEPLTATALLWAPGYHLEVPSLVTQR